MGLARSLIVAGIALLPFNAMAQVSTPPLRILDEGTTLSLRFKLNFIGASVSCVDNAASKRTDCTFSAGGGGVTSNVAGSGITVSGATGAVTISTNELTMPLSEAGATVSVTTSAGNDTIGQKFVFTKSCTVSGGRFYYNGNSSKTIKVTLRDSAGAASQSGTVAVTTAGFYTVSFTPQVVPPYVQWSIGSWETTGAQYYSLGSSPYPQTPTFPFAAGPHYLITATGYGAGDAVISSTGAIGQFAYPDPVFVCP